MACEEITELLQYAIAGVASNERLHKLDISAGIQKCLDIPEAYRKELSGLCKEVYGNSLEAIESMTDEYNATALQTAAERSAVEV